MPAREAGDVGQQEIEEEAVHSEDDEPTDSTDLRRARSTRRWTTTMLNEWAVRRTNRFR